MGDFANKRGDLPPHSSSDPLLATLMLFNQHLYMPHLNREVLTITKYDKQNLRGVNPLRAQKKKSLRSFTSTREK